VRPGIALYGYDPQAGLDRGLQPVLELKSVIGLIKEIPAGSPIGYGGTLSPGRKPAGTVRSVMGTASPAA